MTEEWQKAKYTKIMNKLKNFIGGRIGLCAAIVAAWACLTAGAVSQAQTTAANLSPDLQEIVKFSQAHMSDDVILAYIKNSGKTYSVSADDMLYLNSQGVSQPVISALLQAKSAALRDLRERADGRLLQAERAVGRHRNGGI